MISYPIRLFHFIHLAFSFLFHIIDVTVTQQFMLPITFYMSIENAEKKQLNILFRPVTAITIMIFRTKNQLFGGCRCILRLSKRYWYAH